ncbi:SDR family oxidoreductase [Nibricoccus sp. IMCC34717]|uniref:SDR family oxidoreductase n=1 Tax=Nibricoccus sp. IMCC34717 TaxID=3034021 RepID=UPI00384B4D37
MLQEKHPGKKIVITGVTRGLGRALADWYMANGHVVLGCGRSAEAVMDLRFAISEPHDFSVVDVAEPTKVELWAERVMALQGPPDLLICNAALMLDPAPLWEVPADKLGRLIDVNVKGVANCVHAFVPEMIRAGRGVIVNLSSGWGRSGAAGVAPYCASKFAIEGLTKALAADLPEPLAAVPLNPGIIATDMLRRVMPSGADAYEKPDAWAKRAAPYLLTLGRKDNGRSANVPSA